MANTPREPEEREESPKGKPVFQGLSGLTGLTHRTQRTQRTHEGHRTEAPNIKLVACPLKIQFRPPSTILHPGHTHSTLFLLTLQHHCSQPPSQSSLPSPKFSTNHRTLPNTTTTTPSLSENTKQSCRSSSLPFPSSFLLSRI